MRFQNEVFQDFWHYFFHKFAVLEKFCRNRSYKGVEEVKGAKGLSPNN